MVLPGFEPCVDRFTRQVLRCPAPSEQGSRAHRGCSLPRMNPGSTESPSLRERGRLCFVTTVPLRGPVPSQESLMIPTTVSSCPTSTTAALHKQFLPLLTRVQRHAEVVFRRIRWSHLKEELTAEAVALAWRWFLRLVERGKDVSAFPSALA